MSDDASRPSEGDIVTGQLPVPYVTRFTNRTPTMGPLLVTGLSNWAALMIEWGSLRWVDHAPVSIWIASTFIAICVATIIANKDWLDFKNRRYFPVSVLVLMAVWVGIVGLAYYLDSPAQAAVAKISKETAEDDRDTVVRHLVTALSERDVARRDLAAAKRDLEVARAQQGQPQVTQQPTPEDQIPVNWQPDFQFTYDSSQNISWIRFIGVATDLARIKDAYVISTITGHKESLAVASITNFNERWKVDQVEPIPSGAQIFLVYEPKPLLSLSDFISQWGAFEFHVVYDNKEYVKIYSQAYINSKMAREMPGFGPHVTRRNDN